MAKRLPRWPVNGLHGASFRFIAILTALLFISIFCTGTATAQSLAAPKSAWGTWVSRPANTTCAKGSGALTPTNAATDSTGVTEVHYAAYPSLTIMIPPRGYRFQSVSGTVLRDLARYGIRGEAARNLPAVSVAPEFCASPIMSPKTATGYFPSPDRAASATQAPSPGQPSRAAHYDNSTWAGYGAQGNYNGVYGNWTVEQSASGGPTNHEFTWLGIGGGEFDTSPEQGMIQEGTEMGTGGGYHSFFEFLCYPGCPGSQYAVHNGTAYGVTFTDGSVVRPGDQITGLVYWDSSTDACFSLTDYSRSSGSFYGCVSGSNLDSVPYDTNGIEWIDEKSTGYALSDFYVTDWTYQESYDPSTGATTPFTSLPFFAYIISTPGTTPVPPCAISSDLLAYPEDASSANGGSSDTIWCNWGS